MNTINVIVERGEKNLSAYIENAPIMTTGDNIAEIKRNIEEAIALYLEDNLDPCEMFKGDYVLNYILDTATFLDYYSGVFTKAALSRITGINERQLWHYASGIHKPRKTQTDKIQNGIRKLTNELSSITVR